MRLRALAVCALIASSGCGYALVGKGVTTDASIKKIGVPLFKDTTGKALDQKVTQKVTEELLRRGRFEIVSGTTGVDAVVEGELVNYNAVPVGFTGGDDAARSQAGRYAITLTARVRYTKVGAAEPIWQSDSFSFRDEYDIGTDAGTYLDREEQSIERMTTQFARNLVAAMLEAF
jgi:hypothetical protein